MIRSNGCLSNRTALAMVFKLLEAKAGVVSMATTSGQNSGLQLQALPLMPINQRLGELRDEAKPSGATLGVTASAHPRARYSARYPTAPISK
jgi:hypothetical protein